MTMNFADVTFQSVLRKPSVRARHEPVLVEKRQHLTPLPAVLSVTDT